MVISEYTSKMHTSQTASKSFAHVRQPLILNFFPELSWIFFVNQSTSQLKACHEGNDQIDFMPFGHCSWDVSILQYFLALWYWLWAFLWINRNLDILADGYKKSFIRRVVRLTAWPLFSGWICPNIFCYPMEFYLCLVRDCNLLRSLWCKTKIAHNNWDNLTRQEMYVPLSCLLRMPLHSTTSIQCSRHTCLLRQRWLLCNQKSWCRRSCYFFIVLLEKHIDCCYQLRMLKHCD